MQSATQNAKLNRLRHGIAYLCLRLNSVGLLEADRVTVLIKNWCNVLGKNAWEANRNQLEDMAADTQEFGELENFAKCKELHSLFDESILEICIRRVSLAHEHSVAVVWQHVLRIRQGERRNS